MKSNEVPPAYAKNPDAWWEHVAGCRSCGEVYEAPEPVRPEWVPGDRVRILPKVWNPTFVGREAVIASVDRDGDVWVLLDGRKRCVRGRDVEAIDPPPADAPVDDPPQPDERSDVARFADRLDEFGDPDAGYMRVEAIDLYALADEMLAALSPEPRCDPPVVDEPAEDPSIKRNTTATGPVSDTLCDHICLLDDGHVERGERHFYGYELPSPRRRPAAAPDPEMVAVTLPRWYAEHSAKRGWSMPLKGIGRASEGVYDAGAACAAALGQEGDPT